jgi:hypothetical protein
MRDSGAGSRTGPADEAFAAWFEARRGAVVAVAILFALAWTVLYLQFTADDAFISFRYGKTLLAAHAWNWNPAVAAMVPREEAYSSLIYTLLGIIPALLHVSPALFFKFFGVGCIAVIAYRLLTQARSHFAALLGVLLLGLHPFVAIHAFSGLETPLYILLLVEMALAVRDAAIARPGWVYALGLLLPLTRPEGLVFACVGVVLFWRARGDAPKQLGTFAAAAVAGAAYFLARWRYFGNLLPNPFYAKTHLGGAHGLLQSLADNFSQFVGYLFLLALVFLLARAAVTRVFAAGSLLLLAMLYLPHAMAMNFADRYYFQLALPVFLIFLLVEDARGSSRIAAVAAAIFFLVLSVSGLIYGVAYFPTLRRAQIDLGQRLAPYASGHTLLTGEAGAIPYYSGWITYDFLGLGTNAFARAPMTVADLRRMHPDLILLFGDTPGPEALNEADTATTLAANPVVREYLLEQDGYGYAGASHANGYYLVEFLRIDTPQHDEILDALQQNASSSAETHFSLRDLLLQRYVPWSH